MGVLDFFGAEAGQRRRRALDELGRDIAYYLPPEIRPIVGLLAESTPTATLERAGRASERMLDPDRTARQRVGDLGEMLSETAGVVAPAAVASRAAMPAAQAIQEGLLGMSVPARAAGQAVIDRANQPGPVPTMYSNVPVRANDTPAGIRAFHGSPHDFDRFSMDAIGTGEGAQAYGHGLYFAENEAVARGYRDQLTSRAAPNDARGNAFDLVQRMGGDTEATADILRDGISNSIVPSTEEFLKDTLKHVEDGTFADFDRPIGRMYEVNIDASPEDFLDYDAPLSEQPQRVQDFAKARWQQVFGRNPDPSIEGEFIAKSASPQSDIDGREWLDTSPAADQARRLREAGIKGIKYRDAGSRGVDGKPTRNFVVFDDSIVSIVRKYGIAGAAAMLGISQAEVAQAMQAQQPQPQGLLD